MATSTSLVSLDEYLRCSDYEPDADYVDDHIEERYLGELDHSSLQSELLFLLHKKEYRASFRCYPELRVRVAPRRVRIPDVCLIAHGAPKEQVIQTPPMLCIEVLSPEDRMSRVMVRVQDFIKMGVPEVWIVDPEERTIQVCTDADTQIYSTGSLSIPGTKISLSLNEVFQALDE